MSTLTIRGQIRKDDPQVSTGVLFIAVQEDE